MVLGCGWIGVLAHVDTVIKTVMGHQVARSGTWRVGGDDRRVLVLARPAVGARRRACGGLERAREAGMLFKLPSVINLAGKAASQSPFVADNVTVQPPTLHARARFDVLRP